MYAKLFILCAVAVVALAREYPAGVSPAVCPNYPYCDTKVLQRFYTLDGQPIPEWVYNPSILPKAPADPNANIAEKYPAAKYPADFNAAECPNYPYCW